MFPLKDALRNQNTSRPVISESENLSPGLLLTGKYKSSEQAARIIDQLTPSTTLCGLRLFHAPLIHEATDGSLSYPYILLASEKGEKLLKDEDFFLQIEENPAQLPGAIEVVGDFHSKVYRVPYSPLNTTLYVKIPRIPGHEPFETVGMRLLNLRGFQIPDHLITSQFRSVTEQAEGAELTQFEITPEIKNQMKRFQYFVDQTIGSLTDHGLWLPYNGSGYVSSLFSTDHFFIRDWEGFFSDDPEVLKNSITIVDGITYATNDINCRFAH